MLSRDTRYAAYLVFKMTDDCYGLDSPLQVASSASERTHQPIDDEETMLLMKELLLVSLRRGPMDGWS
ncbi:hypothetical protein HU200_064802 [Digitaria exilis]|uniref:Uncharacterized protein n=1 Tax=Digitaria exilis TaxID=1010633 RepID=A0A835A171_9POAL|nr:hypothetical protein HU200_064802 [Digitaria exilis]